MFTERLLVAIEGGSVDLELESSFSDFPSVVTGSEAQKQKFTERLLVVFEGGSVDLELELSFSGFPSIVRGRAGPMRGRLSD